MTNDSDITPAILLQHILAMRGDLSVQMKDMEERLRADIVSNKNEIKRVECNLSTQIGNIDQRLDEVEIELLPKRVQVLEEMIGIGK